MHEGIEQNTHSVVFTNEEIEHILLTNLNEPTIKFENLSIKETVLLHLKSFPESPLKYSILKKAGDLKKINSEILLNNIIEIRSTYAKTFNALKKYF